MQLNELASLLLGSEMIGAQQIELSGVRADSRKVQKGDLFICLPGFTVDGHDYALQAYEQGAVAFVVERRLDIDAPQLLVKDARFAMAVIANHFYNYPSSEMKVIGITGTNGKTTTAAMLEHILAQQGFKTGLMGTVRMKIGDQVYETLNTTQESLDLHANFRKMREVDTEYCVMEVSSHALDLGRVKGVDFHTAIFTNLTQDHLDYHLTMERYKAAKGLFFSRLGNTYTPYLSNRKIAILNADDPASIEYKAMTSAQVITFGIENEADVMADEIRLTAQGTRFLVKSFAGEIELQLQLIGKFNVMNALSAMTAALCEGVSLEKIKQSLETMQGEDGRFEVIQGDQAFTTIVDYAHTPHSLENVLSTIRDFVEGKVICVFGCGGNRDRSKRPLMGNIAAQYADQIVVTSDNPRSEEPGQILQHIEQGIMEAGFPADQYILIADRKQAIEKAVEMASPKDVVLIAGKGHETYQEIKGVRLEFDDRIVAQNAIRRLAK